MPSKTLNSVKTLTVAAAAALSFCAPLAAQNIGTVASSEPTLRGTPPGAGTRTLNLGTGVVQDETIASSASGRGQIMFIDQTTLSLAPNTTIVLDQFVFNPNGSGQMGLQMTEGALRFIGGTLSRGQEATVSTPTATIGIRGSSALIIHQNGETITVFLAGERLCLTSSTGQRACTSRRGGVLTEDGYQGRVNPAFLAQVLELIDGRPGGSGGAGLGSGVGSPNPSDRGPVSTTGEEFDPEIFDDDFRFDDLFDGLPEGRMDDPYDDEIVNPNPCDDIVPPTWCYDF
ncbi:FecR family protein [Gymnodinialimonas ceratoperidinii]|uniref:FecR family protein n=1 Tax=Gymnodinialimonas ceratoperidinii TaxID=2856823 RepID=A0A8F6TUB7_9RHOB|nr:FecR family protein [Gymnodinialimonas ceratoperidinii]QXT38855.1 FecR family protein [Gymnodinialimonas ceratoperidinii]